MQSLNLYRNIMTVKQTNQQKPKARNGKMSELLTDTRKYIELTEKADVDALRQFLFNEPERSLDAIGESLGLTRERVRQIRERALNKLRKNPRSALLLQHVA